MMKKKILEKPAKRTIHKNDQVMIIAGEESGKKGKVLKVFPGKQRVIVEGINFIKKAQRPTSRNQKGGIIEKEASIHVSNVMIICGRCGDKSRIRRSQMPGGKRVRICHRCGEVLDK